MLVVVNLEAAHWMIILKGTSEPVVQHGHGQRSDGKRKAETCADCRLQNADCRSMV